MCFIVFYFVKIYVICYLYKNLNLWNDMGFYVSILIWNFFIKELWR